MTLQLSAKKKTQQCHTEFVLLAKTMALKVLHNDASNANSPLIGQLHETHASDQCGELDMIRPLLLQ